MSPSRIRFLIPVSTHYTKARRVHHPLVYRRTRIVHGKIMIRSWNVFCHEEKSSLWKLRTSRRGKQKRNERKIFISNNPKRKDKKLLKIFSSAEDLLFARNLMVKNWNITRNSTKCHLRKAKMLFFHPLKHRALFCNKMLEANSCVSPWLGVFLFHFFGGAKGGEERKAKKKVKWKWKFLQLPQSAGRHSQNINWFLVT